MSRFKSRYPACPHCGRTIGYFNRIEKCAFTGERLCSRCIVSGRFSDSVVDKIPPEYREKFRFYNLLPFIGLTALVLWLLPNAWYQFNEFDASNVGDLLGRVLSTVGVLLVALFLGALTWRLPHLGTWMFYWWMSNPDHYRQVERAVEERAEGRYESANVWYRRKLAIFAYLKRSKTKLLFFTVFAGNAAMVVFFFVVRNVPALAGTYFSAFVGVWFLVTLVANLLLVMLAAGYYSHKHLENRPQRRVVELLSWVYVLLFPATFLSFVLSVVAELDLLDLPPGSASGLLVLHQVGFVVQAVVAIGLAYYLMARATPNYDLDANLYHADPPRRKHPLKFLVQGFFVLLLLVPAALALELIILDAVMVISVISSTYLLLGVVLPLVFVALKLVDRNKAFHTGRVKPKGYTQMFWTVSKASAVMAVIFLIPAVGTVTWTNNVIEYQYAQAYGANWRQVVKDHDPAMAGRMNQVPFSAFDALFGFSQEPGPAIFDVPYMVAHPRFVKQGDTIISDGSAPNPNVTHVMTYDAYLPPGAAFGQGSERYPVIIFFHGIGESSGTRNANLTSRYLANLGYVVFDMEYGYTGWGNNRSSTGGKQRGYDFPDTVHQIGNFTHYLAQANNTAYLHADLANVYVSGRSFGGWMAVVIGYGYNLPFFGTNFTDQMTIRGVLPFYGAHGAAEAGDLLQNPLLEGFTDTDAPWIRGSSDPTSPDYNPQFAYFDPYKLADPLYRQGATHMPDTLIFHGTNDWVPNGWSRRLQAALVTHGHTAIGAYYPLASHGFDALPWSQYGQSVLYYMERFLVLSRAA